MSDLRSEVRTHITKFRNLGQLGLGAVKTHSYNGLFVGRDVADIHDGAAKIFDLVVVREYEGQTYWEPALDLYQSRPLKATTAMADVGDIAVY